MGGVEPEVEKQTNRESVYFTVRWSPLLRLEKRTVINKIPSRAGIFEVYKDTGAHSPEIIGRSYAFYGGLRNTLRAMIDVDSPTPLGGDVLDMRARHFVRYCMTDSSEDMDDIMFFFGEEEHEHSGRYRFVYVKEM